MEVVKKVNHACFGGVCDCDDYGEMMKVPPIENVEYLSELKQRKLFINDDIDDYIAMEISRRIIKWNEEDSDKYVRKEITIYINTNGGCLYNCMGLISVMLSSTTPIHTIILAKAFSAGSLIFLAGHKRSMYRYTTLLIHEGSTFAWGAMSKVKEQIEFFERVTKNQVKDFVCSRTNILPKLYDKNYKTELYHSADECLSFGITHEII